MSTQLTRPDKTMRQDKTNSLKVYLGSDAIKAKMAEVLPKYLTPERMVRIALLAVARQPKLLECTPESIALALLTASQLGLEPNGRDAHLVPYGKDCQLIPDYKGLIQLAYRSGQVASMSAKAVHKTDRFAYEFGTDERLLHVPSMEKEPGPLIAAWAMAKLKTGRPVFVVLSPNDVANRKKSAQTDKIWAKYPDAMWAKSAVRELAKWIPQQPELDLFHSAVDMDTKAEVIDISSEPVGTLEDLTAQLNAKPEPADEPPEAEPPEAPDAKPRAKRGPDKPKPSKAEPVEDPPEVDQAHESKLHRDRLWEALSKAKTPAYVEAIHKEANDLKGSGDLYENDCQDVMEACEETKAALEAKA